MQDPHPGHQTHPWTTMTEIRRKLYKRGSSFETTIPMPLLFALDKDKRHYVLFKFEKLSNRWYLEFEEMPDPKSRRRENQ